jgi:hypothetical protein
MKALFSLIAVFLTACGGGNADSAYYPMVPGTGIVYQVSAITSVWDSTQQTLDIQSSGPVQNQQTLEYSRHTCESIGSMFVSTYRLGANPVPDVPTDLTQSLEDAPFDVGGIWYMGEGVNNMLMAVTPGEAKITIAPVVGEVIDTSSRVTKSCTDDTVLIPAYHWRYRTIEHLDTWRGYSDVWHTGLIEFNNGTPATYNYVFAKGIGMVAFWYGNVWNADGTVSGLEYFSSKP